MAGYAKIMVRLMGVGMKLVLASSNQGKLGEFRGLFAAYPELNILPQENFGVVDAEETGLTFVENAIIKARHSAEQTGLPSIADDSGLVVPALNGAPGIYSARYAGPDASWQDRIDKLLGEMKNIPDEKRDAYFCCVIVLMRHARDQNPVICEAFWHGKILESTRGLKGYGYDPVMFIPELNSAVAELTPEMKNKYSHRGQAFAQLLSRWPQIIFES
jgi:XTP/dITP diphosphohydrolase